tara:strand:- start:299 stop:1249 length:951 start_codon:yes stop_codon:yes gene_type:complete
MRKKIPDTNIISSRLVFIGGLTRCGKSFLCPIVSSLKNSEMFICESVAENIYYTYYLKKINYDFAKYLLKHIFNERIYHLKIGRNLNKRIDDYSSILNFKDPKIYFKRERSSIKQLYKKLISKSFYPIMFHDIMLSPNLILQSFKNAKIIYIDRHPVDMVIEWQQKGYYGKIFSHKRNATLSFKYENNLYPYWCYGNEKKLSKINNKFEKIILMLETLYLQQKKNYLKFKKKYPKNIFYVNYDHMVGKTDLILKNLSKFLNTKKDNKTDLIINRENGNRKINIKDRLKNRNYIQKQISYKYIKIFNYLEKIYEKKN